MNMEKRGIGEKYRGDKESKKNEVSRPKERKEKEKMNFLLKKT